MSNAAYIVTAQRTIVHSVTGKCVGRVDEDGILRAYSGPMYALDLLLAMQPLGFADRVQVTDVQP